MRPKNLKLPEAVSPIQIQGAVMQVLNGPRFRVALPNGRHVLARPSGRMRNRFVRINEGDVVHLELSPYDLAKATITFHGELREA